VRVQPPQPPGNSNTDHSHCGTRLADSNVVKVSIIGYSTVFQLCSPAVDRLQLLNYAHILLLYSIAYVTASRVEAAR